MATSNGFPIIGTPCVSLPGLDVDMTPIAEMAEVADIEAGIVAFLRISRKERLRRAAEVQTRVLQAFSWDTIATEVVTAIGRISAAAQRSSTP